MKSSQNYDVKSVDSPSNRVRDSPSYLLNLMKSIAKTKKSPRRRNKCTARQNLTGRFESMSYLNALDANFSLENLPKQQGPYVDEKIFDSYLQTRVKELFARSGNTKLAITLSKLTMLSMNNNNRDKEALDFLLNTCKNVLFMLIILLVVWPLNIIVKIFWLTTRYLCCAFPMLDDFGEFFDSANRLLNSLEKSLIDQISFLNDKTN